MFISKNIEVNILSELCSLTIYSLNIKTKKTYYAFKEMILKKIDGLWCADVSLNTIKCNMIHGAHSGTIGTLS